MNQPLLIRNGRIIDPGRESDGVRDLLVTGEGVVHYTDNGQSLPDSGRRVIDAAGLVVCPGFIDLHCHLRQPGYEEKETIATGTRAAAKGGFTMVCCMPNTDPPLDNPDTIAFVQKTAEKEGPIRVIPIACVTKGRKGRESVRFSELASTGVAGFSDDGSPVYDEDIMRKALKECCQLGLPVIEHCEVPEMAADGVINEGAISSRLGLKGIPAASEELMVERDIRLARETGGWVHIAHVSTAGSVELIRRAKSEGVRITVEVTPHHLTLTEEEVITHGALAKVNPPLRRQADIDALIEGLNDGTIDIIATDHAPHTKEDKECDIWQAAFGISIFETALGSLMTLVHSGKIPLVTLIEKLTVKPAGILGNKEEITGTIGEGEISNLVIIDPDREWTVKPGDFVSLGKNTPLAGSILKGKVMMTISKGKIVYYDDSREL